MVVDPQTWTTLLGTAGFALAVLGYLRAVRGDLKNEIAHLETRLDGKIDGGFSRMDSRLATVESRLSTLEQRTFDLASRLPQPAASPPSD